MSDTHANPIALAKALDDAMSCGIDAYVCLGDIVGYGPSPDEAITLSREVFENHVVAGNHDVALLRKLPFDYLGYRDSLLAANADVPIWLEDCVFRLGCSK